MEKAAIIKSREKNGWIRSVRKSKSITFCSCTDGKEDFQITIPSDVTVNGEIKPGCSFCAVGYDSTTPKGLYEFLVCKLDVLGKSDDTYPIQPKEHGDDFLRTIPESRGRSMRFQAVWKIRSKIFSLMNSFLQDRGYYQFFTPIITSADAEGAGQTFHVLSDWTKESLTVSGQLHLETGMMSLGKVYTFSPCFRAEKSTTKKHLSEFWMLEQEVAFCDMNEIMDECELLLKSVFSSIDDYAEELKVLGVDSSTLSLPVTEPWPRIKYETICKVMDIQYGSDISSADEQSIVLKYGGPVFITHYPKALKPFYMLKEGKEALCFDLIFPEVGEVVGGSQREHRYEQLESEMISAGLDMEKMQWYLNTRKWGSVPHSGFGLGFERLMMFITKVEKVHDVIPFPMSY